MVLISGEAGIGKTRLASHAAITAHGEGATVLWGAASENLGAPYGPWIEALDRYVEGAPEEVLARHVATHGGEIARLARSLPQRMPKSGSRRSRTPRPSAICCLARWPDFWRPPPRTVRWPWC